MMLTLHDRVSGVFQVLKDKRFSPLFKIISGITDGALRVDLACALHYLHDAEEWHEMWEKEFYGNATAEQYEMHLKRMMWYIERAEKDLQRIWMV